MKTPFNVLRHVNQWEMAPRDPVTVGSLLLTGGTAAGVAATGLAAFGYAAVGYLATTAITSWALNALAPDIGGIGGSRGLMVNAKDPAAPHDIVYGTVRKGGIRTYVEATGTENKFLHMILVLAGHELEAIDDIYLDDEIATVDASGFVTSGDWDSKVRIKKHRGNQTAADSLLLSESNQITANFVGNGIAYLYIRLEYDQDVFANGVPMITAKVRGRKVYDPRTASTAYTANASLVVRDYITAGFGLADNAVDDPAFAASANVSDEAIALDGGGTEPRYEINGVVSSDMSPRAIVSRMMSSCGGTLFWGQGKFQLHVGYYSNPVKTFTLDDLRGAISLDTRVGARDNFNRVVGTFADIEVDYITSDFPPIESSVFLAEDNGVENTLDMQLPLTTSGSAAQRLAKMTLFRAREQMTFSAEFGLAAFGVQVGDVVAFTNERYGWTAKEFEVVGWRFEASSEGGDLRINLTLRETSEAAFAWNAEETQIIHNNTNLPSYTAGLTINGLTAAGGGKTQKDGTFIASSILSWTAVTNAFISHYEIQWKPTADSNYSSTTTTQNSIEISPIIDAVGYIFSVRAVTTGGNSGPLASVTFTAGGDVTAPSLPTSIAAVGGFEYITIKWTRPSNADFNYVEVWENATNTTVGATKAGVSSGDEFVRSNLGVSQTKWYFLKSVDYSGNVSAFTSGVFGTTTFVDDASFENGIYSLFTDQGLYAIRDVTSLPTSGAFVGEKVYNRTDGKLYQWTGSAWDGVGASSFSELSGLLQTNQVALDAITNALIANNAVQSENIAALAVTEAKVSANAISTAKIANLAISAGKIADGAATEAKIATDAITGTKISDGAISTPKISAGAITAGTIAANAVTAGKINASAVTAGTIAAGAVTAGTIATNAVTATTIASNSITAAKIATNAVTATKISASSITADKIATNAVTAAKVSAGAITAGKIAASAVTATTIAAGTITGNKISANTITGGLLATSGIITSSAQINNAVVTNAKIGNLAVDSAKIANTLQSTNYVANSSGWRINKSGSAEFYDIAVRGDIVNLNRKFEIGISGNWYRFLDTGTNRSLSRILNQLGGAGTYSFILVGGGGSGAVSYDQSPFVATGGGAGGLANFIYTWNGSTALTADIGAGGAGKSKNGAQRINGSAGAASRFKISGVTRATANGGGAGLAPTTNTASGGAGGTVGYSAASTYFPILSRSVNGSRGGNISTATFGTTGGGGINAFDFASTTPNGGDVTSANTGSSGGGVWGRGLASVSLNRVYGATIYQPSSAANYSADTLGGGFLSSFGAEDLVGGFGVFNNSLTIPSAGSGGVFSGGGSHGNSATTNDRDDATAGSGGIGGGGGAALSDAIGQSGAGGTGALFISRMS